MELRLQSKLMIFQLKFRKFYGMARLPNIVRQSTLILSAKLLKPYGMAMRYNYKTTGPFKLLSIDTENHVTFC